VGHASRSSSLFCVEVNRTRVFQSGFKIGGGTSAGGARGIIEEVASSPN
jgi:hypothetical protein